MADSFNTPRPADGVTGSNGAEPHPPDLSREEFRLRVQCAKLRHWCRDLLEVEGVGGVLAGPVVRALSETIPEMTFGEVMTALRLLATEEQIPVGAIPSDAGQLAQRVTALTGERDELRRTLFALYDAAFPSDVFPSEDDLVREMRVPCGLSISDMLAEFELDI